MLNWLTLLKSGQASIGELMNEEIKDQLSKCSQLELRNLIEMENNPEKQLQYWECLGRDIPLRSYIEEKTLSNWNEEKCTSGFIVSTIHYKDQGRRSILHIFGRADGYALKEDFKQILKANE